MTRERKFAIQMWQGIKHALETKSGSSFDVTEFKKAFLKDNNLNWKHNCWFCQYIPTCSQCPLQRCTTLLLDRSSIYGQVVANSLPTEKRVEACNRIVSILKGGKNGQR